MYYKKKIREELIIISRILFKTRIIILRQVLEQMKLDSLMVSIPENRYYLSGFTGEDGKYGESSGVLFINRDSLLLVTDGRFMTQAHIEVPDYEILRYKSSIQEEFPNILDRLGVATMGFESTYISHKSYTKLLLSTNRSKYKTRLVPTEDLVENIRSTKTSYEIEQIKKSLKLAENAFQTLLSIIKVGMTEIETAIIFERIMTEFGADNLAFPTIIASGPNAAMPHAKVTNRKFKIGEPILFDWGVKYGEYCSDTSRTIIFGTPSIRFVSVYETVLKAQNKAINLVKDGISFGEVDRVARDYINKTEYSGKFLHSIGHGIGLEVHEAPSLSKSRTKLLKSGMVITIEPGIYIPDWGGIRLENQLIIFKDSCLVLNKNKLFPYKLDS